MLYTDGMAARVSRLLREQGLTLSAAESCTGGLIAKSMTDLAGSSSVFCGGVVSYTNTMKAEVLGVPQALLDEFGAVSEPVARAMAEGCRRVCHSDLAVSVTGVAGPDKDDRGNPVGTVFVAFSDGNNTISRQMEAEGNSRELIRRGAAEEAFSLLEAFLLSRAKK